MITSKLRTRCGMRARIVGIRGSNLLLSNYFMAEYFPTTEWRVRARLGLTYGNDDTEKFYSRNDTRYENVETTKKGEFHSNNVRTNQVEAELSVTYAKDTGKTPD